MFKKIALKFKESTKDFNLKFSLVRRVLSLQQHVVYVFKVSRKVKKCLDIFTLLKVTNVADYILEILIMKFLTELRLNKSHLERRQLIFYVYLDRVCTVLIISRSYC